MKMGKIPDKKTGKYCGTFENQAIRAGTRSLVDTCTILPMTEKSSFLLSPEWRRAICPSCRM
jgi:hypothetical protein